MTNAQLFERACVPPNIWEMLNVDPAARMAEVWAGWPIEIRQRMLEWAKVDLKGHQLTIPWGAMNADEQQRILRSVEKCRRMYVALDLTTNWRFVAAAMEKI